MQNSADTNFKTPLAMIVERRALPAKRRGFTQKAKINGQACSCVTANTRWYFRGNFIDMAKEGATSVVCSMFCHCYFHRPAIWRCLWKSMLRKFVFTRFEPSGMVDHPNIKSATSIIDFIFRSLAYDI